jgi:hypothetical protein
MRPEQESGTFVWLRLCLLSFPEELAGLRLADLSSVDEGLMRSMSLQQVGHCITKGEEHK